jgi:hypothetical protein
MRNYAISNGFPCATFYTKKSYGSGPLVAAAGPDCEERHRLRSHTEEARVVRDTLQRPRDLVVPSPRTSAPTSPEDMTQSGRVVRVPSVNDAAVRWQCTSGRSARHIASRSLHMQRLSDAATAPGGADSVRPQAGTAETLRRVLCQVTKAAPGSFEIQLLANPCLSDGRSSTA